MIAGGVDGAAAAAFLSSRPDAEAKTHAGEVGVATFTGIGSVKAGAAIWSVPGVFDASGVQEPVLAPATE